MTKSPNAPKKADSEHDGWIKYRTQLPAVLAQELRLLAVHRGVEIRELIRDAVARYVKEAKRKR